jgi:hypothetical protein
MTTDVTMAPHVSGARRVSATARHREVAAIGFIDGTEPGDLPWDRRNFLVLGLLTGLGLIGLAVAWYGVSGEPTYGDQIPWLVLAVLSLVLGGIGAVYFLTVGAGVVHKAMRESSRAMRTELVVEPEQEAAPVAVAGEYVTSPRMTRVHRHDCPQVRGKAVQPVAATEIAQLGLQACGVCSP